MAGRTFTGHSGPRHEGCKARKGSKATVRAGRFAAPGLLACLCLFVGGCGCEGPDAQDDWANTTSNTSVYIDVLANDSPGHGEWIGINWVGQPTNGSANIDWWSNTVTYTPNSGFSGSDSFEYEIINDHDDTDTAWVTVTVTASSNQPPVAVDDTAVTVENTAVQIYVLANDSDPDYDSLEITSTSSPANGTAIIGYPLVLLSSPESAPSRAGKYTPDGGKQAKPSHPESISYYPSSIITYTPNTGFVGTDSFTYTVSDGNGGTDTATVTVTVDPNQPPVAMDDTATTLQDTLVVIDVLVNDSDPDYDWLSISTVSTPANGTAVIDWLAVIMIYPGPSGQVIWYTPNAGFVGTDSFTYTISDGNGGTDTATVTVTVNPALPNQPPVAVDDAATTLPDTLVDIDVLLNDSDPDSDPLFITAASLPANGTAEIIWSITLAMPSHFVRYTPNAGFVGTDSFTYTISDGNGGTDSATVTVTVNPNPPPPNQPPVAVDDTATALLDTPVEIDVRANDSDPDSDPLSITAASLPANGTTEIVWSITLAMPSHFVRYTPNAGFAGTDSFTYTISDGNGGTDSATVTVTVVYPVPPNQPPVAVDDTRFTLPDTLAHIHVLRNDSDPDGDVLTITAVSTPANGTAEIITWVAPNFYTIGMPCTVEFGCPTNPPGETMWKVVYTPNTGFVGTDSFTYTISDGNGGTDTATVTMTVNLNQPPVAMDDTAVTAENSPVDIDVLANDSDPEGHALTISTVSTPNYGTAQIVTTVGDGGAMYGSLLMVTITYHISYTPNAGFVGTDSFTYTISDSYGVTDTATVTVTVDPAPNQPPVAMDDTATTLQDTPVEIDVRANDSDPDSDPLSITAASLPANGTTEIVWSITLAMPSHFVRYTPNAGFVGTDSFTYTISDGYGGTDSATVTVTVNPVSPPNQPPVAIDDAAFTYVGVNIDVDVLANDSDPDGDPLSVVSVTQPSNGTTTINLDGTVHYAPDVGFTGDDSFTYEISDPSSAVASATVIVTVAPNVAPVAVDDLATTLPDQPVDIDVLANDFDLDGDPLTVVGISTPANGAATLNADGTITYTPNAGFSGTDSCNYTISDGKGGVAIALIIVQVNLGPNGLPVAVDDLALTDNESTVVIDVLANDYDLDGDPLSVIELTAPASGTAVINADGTVSYTSNAGFEGIDEFIYRISDGMDNDAATVTVIVFPANHDPVAADDSATTPPGVNVAIDVLANDTDPDGDALWVSDVTQGLPGTVIIENGGANVRYIPSPGFLGQDFFFYAVSDGRGGTATALVTVTVNTLPVAVDDSVVVQRNVSDVISVLANDSDADGHVLTVVEFTGAADGDVTVNLDDTITYTPNAGYNGADSFTYTIEDELGGRATATVTVYVNAPPVLVPLVANTNVAVPVDMDVLFFASDPDGDPLTVVSTTAPANGVAVLNGNLVQYTPNAGFAGTDIFFYTVEDGNGGSATEGVIVFVNTPPVAVDDTVATDFATAVNIAVLANDSDADSDSLTVTGISGGPTNGTAVIETDGTITYTPNAAFVGSDSFAYAISDGRTGTASAVVTVTVNPNQPPVAVADAAGTLAVDTPVNIDVLANDYDPDNHGIWLLAASNAANGTVSINADDTITYTPAAGFTGTDSFTYWIVDGQGALASAVVTVTVP